MNSSQKNLSLRTTSPWERLKEKGYRSAFIYSFPWEERGLASVAKAEYFPGIGYASSSKHPLLDDYLPSPYSWDDYIAHQVSGDDSTAFPEGVCPEKFSLRDDQQEDVNTIVSAYESGAPQFLIGNGTGTGKTVTTIAALHALNPKSVLIVCPAAVIPVWQRHIQQMGDRGITFVVINYESLKKLIQPPTSAIEAKKTATQNKRMALDGVPYVDFDVVVVDEAHKTKNPTSQQSRIVDTFISRSRFSLLLTATPGKNPTQLGYLWRLLSYNTGDNIEVSGEKDFSTYISWCNHHGIRGVVPARFGNGIDFSGGTSDVEAMEKLIYSPEGVTTAIKRVPGDWLPTVRSPYPVELTSKQREDYQLEVDSVKKILMGISSSSSKKDITTGVAAMMRLRQKTGMLKSPAIVDYTQYLLDDMGHQVVITTIFHNTAEVLSSLLEDSGIQHVIVTGKDNAEEKESKRLAFQRGEVPVIITSITTGISLHQDEKGVGGNDIPRTMVIADVHYSPIEQVQLEGRINRNGQSGVVVFPVLQHTADTKVVDTLLSGMVTQSVLQSTGDVDDMEFLRAALTS